MVASPALAWMVAGRLPSHHERLAHLVARALPADAWPRPAGRIAVIVEFVY